MLSLHVPTNSPQYMLVPLLFFLLFHHADFFFLIWMFVVFYHLFIPSHSLAHTRQICWFLITFLYNIVAHFYKRKYQYWVYGFWWLIVGHGIDILNLLNRRKTFSYKKLTNRHIILVNQMFIWKSQYTKITFFYLRNISVIEWKRCLLNNFKFFHNQSKSCANKTHTSLVIFPIHVCHVYMKTAVLFYFLCFLHNVYSKTDTYEKKKNIYLWRW